jgi:mannose-1-phosphate guanylyltransferase
MISTASTMVEYIDYLNSGVLEWTPEMVRSLMKRYAIHVIDACACEVEKWEDKEKIYKVKQQLV